MWVTVASAKGSRFPTSYVVAARKGQHVLA